MKFKIIKLKKLTKDSKIPKGYRLALLSEFIKHIEEGYKLKKYCWYFCQNCLKTQSPYINLYYDGDSLGVYEDAWGGIDYISGVYVGDLA